MRPVRWKSGVPSSASSSRTACDTEGCETCSASAARVIPPSSTTARKSRSRRRSIGTAYGNQRNHVLDISLGGADTGRVEWVLIAGIGALVGFLGGLFGKGGSAIATPMLDVAGVAPLAAVASPLPGTIPGTLVAAYAYWRQGWSIGTSCAGRSRSVSRRRSPVRYATRWIGGAPLVVATELIVAGLGVRFLLYPSDPHEIVVPPPAPRTRMVLVATHRRRPVRAAGERRRLPARAACT